MRTPVHPPPPPGAHLPTQPCAVHLATLSGLPPCLSSNLCVPHETTPHNDQPRPGPTSPAPLSLKLSHPPSPRGRSDYASCAQTLFLDPVLCVCTLSAVPSCLSPPPPRAHVDSASELVKLYATKFDLLRTGGAAPKKASSGASVATVKALEELKEVINGHLKVHFCAYMVTD